jgi:hypothetical protein
MTAAELHARMVTQTEDRRATGRPLDAGDLVQHESTGEYRVVVDAASAGDCLEARAARHAAQHRKEHEDTRLSRRERT